MRLKKTWNVSWGIVTADDARTSSRRLYKRPALLSIAISLRVPTRILLLLLPSDTSILLDMDSEQGYHLRLTYVADTSIMAMDTAAIKLTYHSHAVNLLFRSQRC